MTGVACASVATVGGYMAESLRVAGRQLEDAAGEIADLRALHTRIVDSINSGLCTDRRPGPHPLDQRRGGGHTGRQPAELRGSTLRAAFGSVLLEPKALFARAADRRLARIELPLPRPGWAGRAMLGIAVSRLSTREREPQGFLLMFQDLTDVKRLEREARAQQRLAAVGEMAAQPRPRDPQPAGVHVGLDPGAAAGAAADRRAGAADGHRPARVASA